MNLITLYYNVTTQQFGTDANDASPYFPPLNLFQMGQYSIAIYLVTPNGQILNPWTYINPNDYNIIAGQISLGNRFNYNLYGITTTYSFLQDANSNWYIAFNFNLDSLSLTSDLVGKNSVSATFQLQITTSSTVLIGQLTSVIRRAVGSGISFGTYIPALINITALTGGAPSGLDGIPTVGGTVPIGAVVELMGVIITDQASQYQLQSYTGPTVIPSIVVPLDASPTNEVAWIQIL